MMVENVQIIPPEKRNLGGFDFFLLWSGAAISIAEIWAGGMLAPLGFWAGLLVILIGHVVGNTPLALGGIIGSEWGIPSMFSLRAAFGRSGSFLASIFNIIQLLGWTAIMVIICSRSINIISAHLFDYSNIRFWILVTGIGSTLWAMVGSKVWIWVQRVAVVALAGLGIFMTYTVLVNISLSQLLVVRGDGSLPWGAGFDIVVAMPISWLPLAADYSRFARKTRSSFLGTWWGYFIMSSWMFLLGFFLSLVTGQSDPVPGMLAMGFGSIAFSVVLFSTFTTTFLDIYSTAVSFLNIIPRIQEKGAVLIFGSAGTILALFFSVEKYENFLYFIGSIFIPLFGVVLFDYFFYRRRIIDVPALLQRKDFDFVAMASWGLGFVCYELFLNYLPVVGASLPSLFTSGGCYLLFRRFGK